MSSAGSARLHLGILLVYALIAVGEFSWASLVPLVPTFKDQLHLSETTAGMLAGATGIAVLAISIPAGVLADRYGARRLTLAASALMSAALVAHLLPGFLLLVGARFLFGIGFGALWTAGIAWVGELAEPADRERALARPMTIAGVSWMFAPVAAGGLAQLSGVRLPFVATGVVGLAVCVLLLRVPEPAHVLREATPSLGETLRRAAREPVVVASLLFTLIASCSSAAIYLLVPLQLHDDGLSAGAIGAAFSVAALVFALGSWIISRLGGRAMQVVVGGAAVAALALVLVLPVFSTTVPALVVMLVLRAPLFAVLFGISYPLGGLGADRAGIGRGVVLGLLNGVWAFSNVVGPIAGGALADLVGRAPVYVLLALGCAATAAWVWPQRRLAVATG